MDSLHGAKARHITKKLFFCWEKKAEITFQSFTDCVTKEVNL